jgi:thymidylate synthase (FAD)
MTAKFSDVLNEGVLLYEEAMAFGVAPEQARVFLPAYALYIRWIWTGSLQGVLHLIEQRTAPDAQWEFQQYANVVESLTRLKFPNATSAFLKR